ncbi:hypothetical protein BHF71_02750 [Vulcanibacillus modesticaldus]|uniref:DNA 3'-5' helicase n=1 Tax=Vulcanibacillus modesticaldus TaxID=337097 RepID=A0A1D2YT45_9BACI|nr:UvrD-helicase domain-containing protein [Vulcanibacillus modesticaldus]OEF98863.1 hypothetical protein BHF71_02750 [Vulcanibacillus modesticaldus]
MVFPLTDEQQFAVDTLNINCIVPAGAGSGKTRVLVERYLKIIEKYFDSNPNIIEEIVAITFTEKAAREMKERVRQGMIVRRDQALENNQLDKAMMWRENIQKIERATISTIHSFCAKVLREFPVEANIDPEFKVLDSTETSWILAEVVEKELMKILESEKLKGISPLYQWVKVAGFKRAVNQLLNLYNQITNSGIEIKELERLTEESFNISPYQLLTDWDELIISGDELYYGESNGKKFKVFQEKWPYLKSQILQARETGSALNSVIDEMCELTKGNLGSSVKELRKKANDQANLFREKLKAIDYHQLEREYLLSFYSVLNLIDSSFKTEKERMNGLDFDDLQLKTIRLLSDNQEVRKIIHRRTSFLMIDEFQDNNQIQKKLISLLLEDENRKIRQGKLFVVGDPKQSIYRFRGADVYVFKEMEQEIVKNAGRIAPLRYNFRSDPKIIEFVNFFFSQIMSNDPSSPNYYKEAIAMGEVSKEQDNVEFIPIYLDSNDEENIREKEAEYLATRIKSLLQQGIEAKEIAILFRSMSNVKVYEQALFKKGIPFYVVGGRGFFHKQEIYDLINILEYLTDPSNNIALAGILRSPLVAITDDTLYQIMTKEVWNKPFSRWGETISEVNEAEQEKLQHFIWWITSIKQKLGRIKVFELLEEVIELTNYQAILLALPNGKQAVANIDKLIRLAKNFPGDNPYSIFEFMERIKKMLADDLQEKEAAIESESGNTVKLMTIHQSKGLEFPYVFVPDLSRRPVNDDSLIRFDAKLGLTCRIHIDEEWVGPIRWLLVAKNEKKLEREEAVRLLYVAATRAEKKLIFSGKIEDTKGKFEVKDVLQADTWSKWLDVVLQYQRISIEDRIWEYKNLHGDIAKIKIIYYKELEESIVGKKDNLFVKEPLSSLNSFQPNSNMIDYTSPIQITSPDNVYSISEIKRYQQCPRYYFYYDRLSLYQSIDWLQGKNVDDLSDDKSIANSDGEEFSLMKLTPMLKGTLVHQLLEYVTIFPSRISMWDSYLLKLLWNYGLTKELVGEKNLEEFKEEVKMYLNNFVKSRFFNRIQTVEIKTEYDFILQLKNGKLHGTIDRLEVYPDGKFTIVDYKTDKEINIEQYKSQIMTYALAIMKNFGFIPNSGVLYFIRHNHIEEFNINKNSLNEWELSLEDILAKINNSMSLEDFQQNLGQCYRCPMKEFC